MVKEGEKKKVALLPFLTQFIEDTDAGITGIAKSTNRNYKSTLVRLKGYCASRNVDLNFEDINLDFYDDFKHYLLNEGHGKIPGFNKHIKILKAIMHLLLHTARRSAATNLASKERILRSFLILGVEDVQTLRTYLRASGIESAVVAKDLAFFK